MRDRFQQQTTLGITSINDVKFPLRSRDELPPVLMALQHIFVTPDLYQIDFEVSLKLCNFPYYGKTFKTYYRYPKPGRIKGVA